jgi:hypothetical protein
VDAAGRQCLAGRIVGQDALVSAVNAWEEERNAQIVRVQWRFTTANACIKLKSLYPKIEA